MKKDKEIVEKKPAKDAPKRDREGRTLTAERVKSKAHRDAPEKTSVVLAVPGLAVEADDDDGEGVARALSTLEAMTTGGYLDGLPYQTRVHRRHAGEHHRPGPG